jgi:hypothetical protein
MRSARDQLSAMPDPERRQLREIIAELNRVVDDLERLAIQEQSADQAASNGRHKEQPDRGP